MARRSAFMNTRSYRWNNAGAALVAALAAAAGLFAPPGAAAGGPGSAGMQVLKSDMSPRAAGMAGAFAAVADDIYAMDYNPAGLGQLYIPEASAMYLSGFDDSTLNHLAFGLPLPFIGLGGMGKPGVGVSLLLSDAGSFDYRYINYDGSIFRRSYDAQKDMVFTLGYGEKVYSDEVNLEGYSARLNQYLGMNVKYIKSTMLNDTSPPKTLAFDGGWLLREPNLGLSLGVSIANFGSGLKYGTEITKLPTTLRLGAAYERPTVMDQSVLLAAEADFYTAEAIKSLRFGLEYHFEKIFNLRLGYKAAEDNRGLTMGLGLRYGDMALDFSSGMSNEVYNAGQLAFSYKFSGVTIREYKKKVKFKDPAPQTAAPAKAAPVKAAAPDKPDRKPAKAEEKKKDSDFFWIY